MVSFSPRNAMEALDTVGVFDQAMELRLLDQDALLLKDQLFALTHSLHVKLLLNEPVLLDFSEFMFLNAMCKVILFQSNATAALETAGALMIKDERSWEPEALLLNC